MEWVESQILPGYFINRSGEVKGITGCICKTSIDGGGYAILCRMRHAFKIHKLVADAFIPNPNNLPELDHIDRNRLNNSVENLRWVTRSENQLNKKVYANNTSGVKGVSLHPSGLWLAQPQINGKRYRKYFKTKEEAIAWRNEFFT